MSEVARVFREEWGRAVSILPERLGSVLAVLMPDEPEALGLLALMLLQDSRRDSRFSRDGGLVLLEEQDRALWNRGRIEEGLRVLGRAVSRRRTGPCQLQAAIAAVHAEASTPEETDWPRIALLYGELVRFEPTPVVELNRAVAVAMAEGAERGLELLDAIEGLEGYHLIHSARADLLRRLGRRAEAASAYRAALALEMNAADRAFLERRLAEVSPERRE